MHHTAHVPMYHIYIYISILRQLIPIPILILILIDPNPEAADSIYRIGRPGQQGCLLTQPAAVCPAPPGAPGAPAAWCPATAGMSAWWRAAPARTPGQARSGQAHRVSGCCASWVCCCNVPVRVARSRQQVCAGQESQRLRRSIAAGAPPPPSSFCTAGTSHPTPASHP